MISPILFFTTSQRNILKTTAILVLTAFTFFNNSAKAQIFDSGFYGWKVFEIQENELEYKNCYMVLHPTFSDSNHNSRQKPYIMIARYGDDRSEEISISSGFEFKLSSKVSALIDDRQIDFFAKKDLAWTKTKTQDFRVIELLLRSTVMKVRSDSAFGTYAVDEYSLKGITRAYARMKEVCK